MQSGLPDPSYQSDFYAGVPIKRFLAWAVDEILLLLASVLVVILTLGLAGFIFPLVYLVLSFSYRSFSLTRRSATLGMRLMALEIRNNTGRRLASNEACMHVGAFMVSMAFILPMLISAVMVAASSRHQALHDLLLGSAAINRPR